MIKGRELKMPVIERLALSWPALKPPLTVVEVPLSKRASKTITSTTYILSRIEKALANLNWDNFLGKQTRIHIA